MLYQILAILSAPSATPQTAQTSAAGPLGGTAIPGLCLLSRTSVIASAKVGIVATQRLQQLVQTANAEVDTQRVTIARDEAGLRAQQGKLAAADFQQRQQALAGRVRALQQLAELRGREIQATREKALGRIAIVMQPVVAQAYKATGCGLLVDRNAVLGGNMANDLTSSVIQGLDQRMATISFERETIAPSSTSNSNLRQGD
jgi:Skp family chaperone for outer membrane proteins